MPLPVEPAKPAVQGRRRSLVEQELINSLGWMISLRWLAGAGVLVATAVATLALRVPLPAGRLYLVGGCILAGNAGFWWALRWLLRSRPEATPAFEALARAQIGFDWLAMAVLIASSGGAESPAIIFFLIHITIASLLLPHHHGFLYVTLAPVLVGAVALLEYTGVVPARGHRPAGAVPRAALRERRARLLHGGVLRDGVLLHEDRPPAAAPRERTRRPL